MDLNYSPDELAFRDEVRGWLRANLPQDLREKVENYAHLSKDDLMRWHRTLAKKGWVAPAWPEGWGGAGGAGGGGGPGRDLRPPLPLRGGSGLRGRPADHSFRRHDVRGGAS